MFFRHLRFVSSLCLSTAVFMGGCVQIPSWGDVNSASSGAPPDVPVLTQPPELRAEDIVPDSGNIALTQAWAAPRMEDVVYHRLQKAVYVIAAEYGDPEKSAGSRLLRLNPATLAVEDSIDLPYRSQALVIDEAANQAWIGHGRDNAVSVIDLETRQLLGTIKLAPDASYSDKDAQRWNFRRMALDAIHRRLYIAAYTLQQSVLYVVDTYKLHQTDTLHDLGFAASEVAADPGKKRLFVANAQGQVIVINTATLKKEKTIALGADRPVGLTYDASTERLFSVDHSFADMAAIVQKNAASFLPHTSNGKLYAIYANDGSMAVDIPVSAKPVALAIDPLRKRIYVACRSDGTIAVYDAGTFQRLHTIPLQATPRSMALDVRNNVLYVTLNDARHDTSDDRSGVARVRF